MSDVASPRPPPPPPPPPPAAATPSMPPETAGSVSGSVPPVVAVERRSFHMKSCLGRGGFGEVYRATMVSAGGVRAEVAVKVLHAEVDPTSQAVQRLRDEGRMLGAVRHPVVLRVHDLVLLEGRVALITEYVDGQDLDRCVYGPDPLPLRALVEMVGKIAEALHAAYTAPSPTGDGQLELVHRDIKPANIRLGRHGEVKLLDFGIARAANVQREARTETNAMLGSYLYMAPERFLDNADTGCAIDVYSLGLTLFEGIVRRRMFGEMSLKDLYLLILDENRYDAHIKAQLETIPKEVPHQIVALIYRMLGLTPAQRPDHLTLSRTCFELADRLSGKPLDRWARQREWPPARTVRGMLDGTTITETAFSNSASYDRSQPLPTTPLPSPRVPSSGSESALIRSLDAVRTATGTLDRPGVVVAAGFGLFGVAAVLGIGFGAVIVLGTLVYVLFGAPQVDPMPPLAVDPAPVIAAPSPTTAVPEPTPMPTPTPVAARPHNPSPTPSPAPVAVAPEPAPQPEPQPVVAPDPVPVPAPAVAPRTNRPDPAVIEVAGGVVVKFRGSDKEYTAGLVPPGTYDIVAVFDGKPLPQGSIRVEAAERVKYRCSKMTQSCAVEP